MRDLAKSVSSYLEWVREVHRVDGLFEKSSMYQDHVYFRGHASSSWELVPSLFRDEYHEHDEHLMLEMANNMLWSELGDCKSELEKMIRLQHYGLHTRLLDVTYNPLVALYFACQLPSKTEDDKDGVVYCGYIEESNHRACRAIAEYVFNNETKNINRTALEKTCSKNDVKVDDIKSIYFISPPINNPRISIQHGAFIMSPLLIKDAEEPFDKAIHADIRREMKTAFEKHIDIPAAYKTSILKELDYLGFNRATIYTDISSKLQYINEKENEAKWPDNDLT